MVKRKKTSITGFISQLSRIKVSVERQNLMSLDEMTKRLHELEDVFSHDDGKKFETKNVETMIDLRLSYIMMCVAFEELYGITPEQNSDLLVEKSALIQEAYRIEEQGLREYADIQANIAADARHLNEYRVLGIREMASIRQIESKYNRSIVQIKDDLEGDIRNRDFKEDRVIKVKSDFEVLKKAKNSLSNPEYKLKLDEILLLNFNPNQAKKYIPNNFADVTYIPEKKYIERSNGGAQEPSFIGTNSEGDQIIVIQTADLGYGRFRLQDGEVTYRDPYALKEYRIIKKYKNPELVEYRKKRAENGDCEAQWDKVEDGEAFTVYGKINVDLLTNTNVDKEYIRYNNDVLLSTTNLEEACKNNGGYVGEIIIDPKTKEYIVDYDTDALCLAKEFENVKIERRAIGEPICGIGFLENIGEAKKSKIAKNNDWSER